LYEHIHDTLRIKSNFLCEEYKLVGWELHLQGDTHMDTPEKGAARLLTGQSGTARGRKN
jgi:hypothetical protein